MRVSTWGIVVLAMQLTRSILHLIGGSTAAGDLQAFSSEFTWNRVKRTADAAVDDGRCDFGAIEPEDCSHELEAPSWRRFGVFRGGAASPPANGRPRFVVAPGTLPRANLLRERESDVARTRPC